MVAKMDPLTPKALISARCYTLSCCYTPSCRR